MGRLSRMFRSRQAATAASNGIDLPDQHTVPPSLWAPLVILCCRISDKAFPGICDRQPGAGWMSCIMCTFNADIIMAKINAFETK